MLTGGGGAASAFVFIVLAARPRQPAAGGPAPSARRRGGGGGREVHSRAAIDRLLRHHVLAYPSPLAGCRRIKTDRAAKGGCHTLAALLEASLKSPWLPTRANGYRLDREAAGDPVATAAFPRNVDSRRGLTSEGSALRIAVGASTQRLAPRRGQVNGPESCSGLGHDPNRVGADVCRPKLPGRACDSDRASSPDVVSPLARQAQRAGSLDRLGRNRWGGGRGYRWNGPNGGSNRRLKHGIALGCAVREGARHGFAKPSKAGRGAEGERADQQEPGGRCNQFGRDHPGTRAAGVFRKQQGVDGSLHSVQGNRDKGHAHREGDDRNRDRKSEARAHGHDASDQQRARDLGVEAGRATCSESRLEVVEQPADDRPAVEGHEDPPEARGAWEALLPGKLEESPKPPERVQNGSQETEPRNPYRAQQEFELAW